MNKIVKITGILIIVLFVFQESYAQKHLINLQTQPENISEREAIVVIHGLGGSKKKKKKIFKALKDSEYDIYIPDFLDHNSLDSCYSNFDNFWKEYQINDYKKVHVLSYILGGYVINRFIRERKDAHITSVLYDRSPTQERAPYVLVKNIPRLIRMIAGPVVEEFYKAGYTPVEKGEMNIGLIIESKATIMVKTFQESALDLGPYEYAPEKFNQDFDDFFYIPLNHFGMYTELSSIKSEIFEFCKNSRFSENARREPFKNDAFHWDKEIKN